MRVVVTGGAGLIGSAVCEALLAAGHDAAVIDDLSNGRRDNVPSPIALHVLTILDDGLGVLMQKLRPEAVVHLAAHIDVPQSIADPANDARANVEGTIRVVRGALDAGARAIAFASSGGAVYGDATIQPTPESAPLEPLSPYGLSKAAAETYVAALCRAAGARWANLRFANVFGPRQDASGEAGVVSVWSRAMIAGAPTTIYGDGLQTRDLVFSGDVAAAILAAIGSEKSGTWNIGSGVETTVRELHARMAKLAGRPDAPVFAPARPLEVRRSVLDASRARLDLGWTARTSLEDGLAKTLDWARAHRI